MTWNDVISQQQVVDALRRAVASERVPHALLFHGPDGSGKRAAALALAQTLQCEKGGDEPCNVCRACDKVSRLIHPDVRVLLPYSTDVDDNDVAERLPLLAAEPYATIDFVRRPSLDDPTKSSNRQALYTVDRVHESVLRPMRYRPVEGRMNVAIVTDADAMNRYSANAFLKLLEEPPEQSIFILTSSHVESLLPTIISRCQRFRFDPLEPEAIEEALVTRRAISPDHAAFVARMSDGSYSRALDLLENKDLAQARDRVVEFLRRSLTMDIPELDNTIAWISSHGRDQIKAILGLMLSWARDIVLWRSMGTAAPITNVDQRDSIERFCVNLPDADLNAIVEAVEQAILLVERNVKEEMVLIGLAFVVRDAMRGVPGRGLYVPLSTQQ